MRSDFCAFILTHGRPDSVKTYNTLRKHGYTGPIYLVIDDEDDAADKYYEKYGDEVVMFSKSEIAKTFDEGDNFDDRRTITYARNASFDIAKSLGYRYFVQLDDDYSSFSYRFDEDRYDKLTFLKSLDWLFSAICDYLTVTPFASIAIAQGGDHIGHGYRKTITAKRKAMNSFVCDTERRFSFVGRFNEDVNTYTSKQRSGTLFLTILAAQLTQGQTQGNVGGSSEFYQRYGTYVKSFMTVMYAPSCVKVSTLGDPRSNNGRGCQRIHHRVSWVNTAPCIIREKYRKVV